MYYREFCNYKSATALDEVVCVIVNTLSKRIHKIGASTKLVQAKLKNLPQREETLQDYEFVSIKGRWVSI